MPILYVMTLALLMKFIRITPQCISLKVWKTSKGGYNVLGIMVMGLTLSRFSQLRLDWKFRCTALVWKHLIYPLAALYIALIFFRSKPRTIISYQSNGHLIL